MKIEEIVNILQDELSSVYCDNCNASEGDSDDYGFEQCDNCHRKMMNWGLSTKTAKLLALRIIKLGD
ncbi:hypothetical protein N9924_00875 [bacterium]|nr:hypothetical protein [bacterium]